MCIYEWVHTVTELNRKPNEKFPDEKKLCVLTTVSNAKQND